MKRVSMCVIDFGAFCLTECVLYNYIDGDLNTDRPPILTFHP